MSTKTTGAEFKRFYADKTIWTDGVYHEDNVMTLNGLAVDGGDFPYETVSDDDVITLSDGYMSNDAGDDLGSFEGVFKKWRKKQTTASIVVECDLSLVEAVKAAIKAAGGKVV